MKLLDYPFYRLVAFFIIGIVVQFYVPLPISFWLLFVALTLFLSLLGYFIKPFAVVSKSLLTISVMLFFAALGGCITSLKSGVFPNNHYSHAVQKGEDAVITLLLREQLSSNSYNHRFYADVTSYNWQVTQGKILVLFKRSDSVNYKAGQELIVYDDVNDASNGRNPGDFNYKEYLKGIDVYGQVYVDKPKILQSQLQESSLPWYVRYRNKLLQDLEDSNLTDNSRSLVEALVLGQRQNVDPTITQNFRDAGVIHILALSGLHVGIILLILQFCLKWMKRLPYGNWIQTVIIISLLWCFALLTGMSPSILRAVTMFSFVAIGMNINRNRSVFHSLTISAFCLLVYDPRLLFQVGFQLSYTAVIAIVLLQPLFMRLFPRIKYWLPNKLVQIFTVTLAAQIGVAPLSIYYFHQLPLAFLVGNLALLLILPLILGLSITFIILLQLGVVVDWLGNGLNFIFETIISFVGYISSFQGFVWKDIYLRVDQLILIYIFLLGLIVFVLPIIKRSRRERFRITKSNYGFHIALAAMIGLVCTSLFHDYKSKESFMVLHQSRGSAVAISNAKESKLLVHLSSMDNVRRENSFNRLSQIENFQKTTLKIDSLPAMINYKNIPLIVIDESALFAETSVKEPIVLLSNSPKINLNKVITKLNPKLIITDGSNYRNFVDRWKATCNNRNVDFVNTYDEGAIDLLQY
ncbi:competence protein ComEC [Nonlabens sp. Hel1_33_55]|uniref:ComEC/Rec2 family competence protein n=1 Tax=Nonlabens sp. Hel1_33_55 TaxID=1336802 RepID=UPI000875DF34|nr:ComEC/Rec2 family competence protein [Nonlabens sp. Hel1_33_55]SCY44430.1 competence protein ComEC [Nonlabens sp. Hel1_33_55]